MATNGVTAKRRSRVLFVLANLPDIAAGGLLVVMASVVVLQVFFRYIMKAPISWSEEVANYTFIWLSTLSAALGVKYGLHFAIEAGVNRLPGGLRRIVNLVTSLAITWLLLVLIWYGIQLVLANTSQISSVLGIPMSIPYLSVPVSCALMLIYLWTGILRNTQQVERPEFMPD